MSDTSLIMRYVGLIALVAVVAVSVNEWDSSTPLVSGWAGLQDTVSDDPETGFPQFATITPPQNVGCAAWDILCNAGNLGGAVMYIGALLGESVSLLVRILAWFFSLVFNFFAALFGSATLTYDGMPSGIQSLMWILIAPFFALLIFTIIKLVRGNEG